MPERKTSPPPAEENLCAGQIQPGGACSRAKERSGKNRLVLIDRRNRRAQTELEKSNLDRATNSQCKTKIAARKMIPEAGQAQVAGKKQQLRHTNRPRQTRKKRSDLAITEHQITYKNKIFIAIQIRFTQTTEDTVPPPSFNIKLGLCLTKPNLEIGIKARGSGKEPHPLGSY
jgi:hypothetical protein